MKNAVWIVLGAALLSGTIVEARGRGTLRERIAERMAERADEGPKVASVAPQVIAYGSDALQQLDFYRPARASGPAPLIVFVHGGAWSKGDKDSSTGRYKPPHFTGNGYAFASINYRLVPKATVEQQAQDVASALAKLRGEAARLGIDTRKIVLMGHSAGAHLVALVSTDERYLKAAGLSFADIAGTVPIDGACYDVPAQMNDGPGMMKQAYVAAFGTDLARQKTLSPTYHAGGTNMPAFYLMHVQRPDGVRQAQAFAAELRKAGARVTEGSFEGKGLMGHLEINRKLGDPSYPATPAVDRWLAELFRKA